MAKRWRGPEFEGEFPSLGPQLIDLWYDILPSPRDETKPFLLTPRQARNIVDWYAVHPVTGKFVYRRGVSQQAKKTGKSPIEAAKAISELALPVRFDGWDADGEPVARPWGTGGDPAPWVQIASLSEDQDDNTWTPLYTFLTAANGRAADLLNIDAGLTRCFLRTNPAAKIEPVTSRAGSREGQPVTYGNLDETGLMTETNGGVKLAKTIRRNTTGMGGRVYETTNGYSPGERSVAEQTHKAAIKAGDILYDCIEAPRSIDGELITEHSPDAIIKAALGVPYHDCWWTDVDRLVKDLRDDDMTWSDAKRFFFNWNEADELVFIDASVWDPLADEERIVEPGEYVALGFDGSISEDCTVLYGCTADRYIFQIATWSRPPGEKDWRVPRLEVDSAVNEAFEQYQVGRMFCDPAKWWTEIETWVERFGKDANDDPRVVILDTNSAARFAPLCDRFAVGVTERAVSHDGKEMLTLHLAGSARKKVHLRDDDDDGRTKFVIVKADTRKIDAAVAAVLANGAAESMPEPQEEPSWFGGYA